MNWINADSTEKLDEIKELSNSEKVLILKFSTGCGVNYAVRNLLEREWTDGEMRMKTYIVDVLASKELSGKIANDYAVEHESPQVLIIKNGKPVFTASHGRVLYSEIRKHRN
jgi:bacillithiol system protein YtxJ